MCAKVALLNWKLRGYPSYLPCHDHEWSFQCICIRGGPSLSSLNRNLFHLRRARPSNDLTFGYSFVTSPPLQRNVGPMKGAMKLTLLLSEYRLLSRISLLQRPTGAGIEQEWGSNVHIAVQR
jgi:hypothetical protein